MSPGVNYGRSIVLMGHLAWSHQDSDKHGNLVSKYPPVDLKYFTSLMPKLVLISNGKAHGLPRMCVDDAQNPEQQH